MKLLIPLLLFTTLVSAQIVNIPDPIFKAELLKASPLNTIASTETPDAANYYTVTTYTTIDTNGDGEIQESEANVIKYLKVYNLDVVDLSGILSFSNLEVLECNQNLLTSLDVSNLINLRKLTLDHNRVTSLNLEGLTNLNYLSYYGNQITNIDFNNLVSLTALNCGFNGLTSLDVSMLINLTKFECGNNDLTSIDVSNLTQLNNFQCQGNQFANLDLSALSNLKILNCNSNLLTSLDVSNLINLTDLSVDWNKLSSLDVSVLTNLRSLWCISNQLTDLDVSNLASLKNLFCSDNLLTSLDISACSKLDALTCDNNQLTSLYLKNNISSWSKSYSSPDFSKNPRLKYVCANEKDLIMVKNKINQYGYSNCHVNSYCSFNPGGVFYKIDGSLIWDLDVNGCDINDSTYPNIKFNITNGIVAGTIIANSLGFYSIPVVGGTHNISPKLENPEYFNITPTSAIISFPTEISPFTQNFCITPNGVHNDLEVTIVPIRAARPGFDAKYKIKYKNKGNIMQSGTLTLTFDDAVLDLVSANPLATVQLNNLSWNFTNLKPFESGEILVTFNLNSPLEIPALNGGDKLSFTTTITAGTDETPIDNTFTLKQTLVNSYDPNDKICLEGDVITPEKVGQFVHYRIRFENKGTAEAINIVVKDIIDTNMFDISTLVVTDGSHEFVTKISNTNTVEFIFEGINLPFDDANNDGYLVFKIKTKPTVVLGNILKNKAEIYFDYNFPIITNEYKTTVQNEALSTNEYAFTGTLSVYPNPVKDVLNIDTKAAILKLEVFDMAGRIVSVNNLDNNKANLGHLQPGIYIAKIYTDACVKQIKVIKE